MSISWAQKNARLVFQYQMFDPPVSSSIKGPRGQRGVRINDQQTRDAGRATAVGAPGIPPHIFPRGGRPDRAPCLTPRAHYTPVFDDGHAPAPSPDTPTDGTSPVLGTRVWTHVATWFRLTWRHARLTCVKWRHEERAAWINLGGGQGAIPDISRVTASMSYHCGVTVGDKPRTWPPMLPNNV